MSLALRLLFLALFVVATPIAWAEAPAAPPAADKGADKDPGKVDLNNAGEAELAAIPGIGEANAKKIVAARPFDNKAQLVSRKILSKAEYEKVKDRLIAKHAKPGDAAKTPDKK